jgi:hemerythrin
MTLKVDNLFDWSDQYSVGIEEIDEQHKKLMWLLNKMYQNVLTKNDAVITANILEELIQYTIIHFAVEESLMQIFDYDGYDTHKRHHDQLKQQVLDIRDKFRERKIDINIKLFKFLKSWLLNHILLEDKQYMDTILTGKVKQLNNKSFFSRIFGD